MVERVRTIHQILAELEILSEVSANQHHDKIHGGTPNRAPKGPKLSLADQHRQAYEQANGPGQRAAALKNAKDELFHARFSPSPLMRGTLEWQHAIARDSRSVEDIAAIYGCSMRHVYRVRAMFRANPSMSRRIVG